MNILFLKSILFFVTNFYSLSFPAINGTNVPTNNFRGKKLLLVNIATGSRWVSQIGELEQLQKQYRDSLIVIGFPSNSFNHESRSNGEIKQFCHSNYNVSFLLAKKGQVKGPDKQPIYNWLSTVGENGAMDGEVIGDFQKYLISAEGSLIGVFAPTVNPLDSLIQNAILER
jgi:glutathione peroxidase